MRQRIILRGSIAFIVVAALVILCSPGCVSQEELQSAQKENQKLSRRVAELEKQVDYYKNASQLYSQQVAKLESQLVQTRERLRQATAQSQQTTGSALVVTTTSEAKTSGSVYTVVNGDCLWDIAEDQLGNGVRYKEILALNPNITNEDSLAVGARLNLPSK